MQSYIGSISSSVTAEELIKVYAHLAQLGAEAETITVSGMKNLSTGFGIAGVISGALWPDDTIMPGFQEQDIVLDHVMGGYVHNSELRKLVITSIKENDSSLLVDKNIGNNDNGNDKLQVHRVVPQNIGADGEEISIIDKWSIGIHDISNASILHDKFHNGSSIHGRIGAQEKYGRKISDVMKEANKEALRKNSCVSRQAVIRETLRNFAMELVVESGDLRSKALQDAINVGAPLIGK